MRFWVWHDKIIKKEFFEMLKKDFKVSIEFKMQKIPTFNFLNYHSVAAGAAGTSGTAGTSLNPKMSGMLGNLIPKSNPKELSEKVLIWNVILVTVKIT